MSVKITLAGKKNLETQLEDLFEQLKQVREEKALAYELTGDTWHDNPYFNKLEQNERALNVKIQEVQATLKSATIVETEERNMEEVAIGSIILCACTYLEDQDTNDMVLEIVGQGETDIESGKISYESLVSKNILGLHVNEEVTFDTPGGKVQYKILQFFPDWEQVREAEGQ